MAKNEIGLNGIEFIEFSSPKPENLRILFREFGFTHTMSHKEKKQELYQQGQINIIINCEAGSFSESFYQKHGPCLSSMGWKLHNPEKAHMIAVERGAKASTKGDYSLGQQAMPSIQGIGDSLIYFVQDAETNLYEKMGFVPLQNVNKIESKGFYEIDHLTNNVFQGTMEKWSNFYKKVFEFEEVRYFDIRGAQTGLVSYALKSPCGKFCIPINEGTEEKSQINEYLREYDGPGVQHIAFANKDIVSSLEALQSTNIETLDIDEEYYQEVFDRVPNVSEDHKKLEKLNILVDGDDQGYLLQIFTKNIIGPIFIEIIQRKNHFAFGEGNFGALFRSIEKDQKRRGVL